ncbi:hypothetical protein NLJ89_g4691 [Agrocybe chaxingu]|uniref:Major facilitator superfamily (MFS) profile domain-containing protein n=1 Tax=Agrocybe chaxingu TaxID=84603 RepID=A0A9W8K9D2_9AGAR|nr:hypothetical protein NLJ89_g4691 [Agrocybe chaxingu]
MLALGMLIKRPALASERPPNNREFSPLTRFQALARARPLLLLGFRPGNLPTGDTLPSTRPTTTGGAGAATPEPFSATSTIMPGVTYDIEHVPVKNDPRAWSPFRKNASLALVASASMIAGLAANIQNRKFIAAVEEMEEDLPATSSQFSLSIAMFILIQGVMPLLWSAMVYLVSLALFTLGTIVVALSRHIDLVIGFRCLQAAGSSAVMAIGAATLADIFEPEERGAKMGIYYIAPLLGPAVGPIFGGFLTSAWNWRAIFWFLAIVSGSIFLAFVLFFHDTFRSERSLTYQNVLKQRLRESANHSSAHLDTGAGKQNDSAGNARLETNKSDVDIEKTAAKTSAEEVQPVLHPTLTLSIRDVNPFKPMGQVLFRKNNFNVLLASGLLFAFAFLVPYTSARTLAKFYRYSPLKIGLVTLSYGAGSVAGSLVGGRWSDRSLAHLKAVNGGKSYPEMRLKSTIVGACLLPPCSIALGWVCEQHVHVSAICVFLFVSGFFNVWIYTSTLAYIVDANVGRSSTAVAANSAFRGTFAFVATEIAVPLQDGLGDGWMYTIWGGIMALSGALVLLVSWKGVQWRQEAERREAAAQKRSEENGSRNASSGS